MIANRVVRAAQGFKVRMVTLESRETEGSQDLKVIKGSLELMDQWEML